MKDKKMITITVDEETTHYISDILCWFEGYKAGKGEYDDLIEPAMERIKALNLEIKAKIKLVKYD